MFKALRIVVILLFAVPIGFMLVAQAASPSEPPPYEENIYGPPPTTTTTSDVGLIEPAYILPQDEPGLGSVPSGDVLQRTG